MKKNKIAKSDDLVFHSEHFSSFREWLDLRLQDITWQGRFSQEFEDFWTVFFVDNISLTEILNRFQYVLEKVTIGPLNSWFIWLRNKFIFYVFLNFQVSILDLSLKSKLPVGELATLLRDLFLERFPYLEAHLSELFQCRDITDPNAKLTFKEIQSVLHVDQISRGSHEDEIMSSLEITLYQDWKSFLRKIKQKFKSFPMDQKSKSTRGHIIKTLYVLRNFMALVGVALFLFYFFKYWNIKYEKRLEEKISIYEPKLQWLDQDISYREPIEFQVNTNLEVDLSKLNEEQIVDVGTIERDGTESEVILSSLFGSGIPSFYGVDSEISDFEEESEQGARDYRYGRNVVYRVMLKSDDVYSERETLKTILDQYQVERVDTVVPGKIVPGGAYYNIYVPTENVKPLLTEVIQKNRGIVYESRTRTPNPKGKGRVFIWVKSI